MLDEGSGLNGAVGHWFVRESDRGRGLPLKLVMPVEERALTSGVFQSCSASEAIQVVLTPRSLPRLRVAEAGADTPIWSTPI